MPPKRRETNESQPQQTADVGAQSLNVDIEELIAATTRAVITSLTQPSDKLNYADIGTQIPTFGDKEDEDVETWLNRVDEIKDAFEVSDKIIKVMATKQFRGKVREWYNSTPGTIQRKWEDLKQELKLMFGSYESHISVMKKMENRKWKPGETFSSYFYDKIKLTNRLKLTERDTIDYVVQGIDNYVLRTHALAAKYKTTAELLESMKLMSEDKVNRVPGGSHVKVESKKTPTQTDMKMRVQQVVKCYNCGEQGHIAPNCQKESRPRGSCYKCGEMGHTIKTCPKENRSEGPGSTTALMVDDGRDTSRYYLIVMINTLKFRCLIDSGSAISIIRKSHYEKYFSNYKVVSLDNNMLYNGINSTKLDILGFITCNLGLLESKYSILCKFAIVPDTAIPCNMLLGQNFLSTQGLVVTFGEKLHVKYEPHIVCETVDEWQDSDYILHVNCVVDMEESRVQLIESRIAEESELHDKQVVVEKVLDYYGKMNTDTKPTVEYEMKLNLNHEIPFYFSPRRLSWAEKIELRKILDDLLAKNIIRPSSSPYASQVVLVPKKDKSLRLCIDYRELNKLTVKEHYPLPVIDDYLARLHGKKYFTGLDLKAGFHHVKIAEESIKYTSFVTPDSQMEFVRMPFGLVNAPSNFQRYINLIFKELLEEGLILIYLDDILIPSTTVKDNLEILGQVLHLMYLNKLELRLDKCYFLYKRIKYLGYYVSEKGIEVSDEHINAVKNFPKPSNSKQVHRFLGLTGYLRRFIKDYSLLAKPLFALVRKNAPFVFGEVELKAFELLKEKLMSPPILAIYSPTAYTELHTDASATGYGAILMQKQSDGKLHPVFYHSRRTIEHESKYHSYELETLAIIYALERFRIYLHGIKFIIITDCNAFKLTMSKRDLNPRIARWALFLQNYDYEIIHRKGDQMCHVDALSRSILIVEPTSLEQALIYKQLKDSVIQKISKELENSESSEYEMRNGVVYKKKKDNILFYVPESMEYQIIHSCHDEVGHIGSDKTIELISRSYWFPKLRKKVLEYIANCLKCILFSVASGKSEGTLKIIEKGDRPLRILNIDHFGPLERTEKGYQHILLIVDAFSKFTWLHSVKTTGSQEAVNKMKLFIFHFGLVDTIVSDRGTSFTSDLFAEFINDNGMKHVKVATGSPQSNGQVERVNRFLKSTLSKISTPSTWDQHLSKAQFVINNTYNRSIGTTPSMVLFGYNQKGFLDDELRNFVDSMQVIDEDIQNIRYNAKENTKRMQAYNKTRYDAKHKRPKVYNVGDLVMIRNVVTEPGLNKKLLAKYRGPYEVKHVLEHDRYVIGDIEGYQLTQKKFNGIVGPERMKLWIKDVKDVGQCEIELRKDESESENDDDSESEDILES